MAEQALAPVKYSRARLFPTIFSPFSLLLAMRKSFLYFLRLCLAVGWPALGSLSLAASPTPINVYLFSAKGCYHCLDAKKFLVKLKEKHPQVKVVELELTASRENQEIFRQVAAQLQVDLAGAPCIVIGGIAIVGWQGETATGAAIERALQEAGERHPPDLIAPLLSPEKRLPEPGAHPQIPERLSLPFIGTLETGRLSLGLLTVLIGAMDGFNPCAMWALVFLIGLLFRMENRARMWALGSLFIGGSGLVYFFFMTAWLNIFLVIGLVVWIRVAIGVIALAAAGLNLREYFFNKGGACTMLGGEKRQGLMARIKTAIEQQSFLLAAAGIFFLGVAVNLVELFCSAGLPVVYTQILTLSRLPVWQYYAYLALYILVFMLDDLIVFVVSMLTLQHFGITSRYKRFSNLVGGLVLLLVGLLLIFKPDLLMFG